MEKLTVKVRHVDAHVSKSQANEEHHNNEQVDKAAKVKVSQVDLDWQHKGEVFLARWAHDASGHQGRDATYRWARDRGVDLTMDNISQGIHNCETCAAIKQAKRCKKPFRWTEIKSSVSLSSGLGSQTPLPRSLTIQGNQRNALDCNKMGKNMKKQNVKESKNFKTK
ncbi:hypothetical protein DUI87_01681 [Hirundo rustica rustica]|uniref:Integrase zinc-binding domain-containing protein n=1 Tax=Hirundo rustica rustica TaxID=333673 RepID=A0A3M0L631_HIRRU|nr:hypothetical protein DUI87_01681 [Hirundo rustica rustica]